MHADIRRLQTAQLGSFLPGSLLARQQDRQPKQRFGTKIYYFWL